MSLDEEELIGVWSAGAGYYDTFSDEFLIFNPDGTGRMEGWVLQLDSVDFFEWKVVAPGLIDLIGDRHVGRRGPNGESMIEILSDFHFRGIPFNVAEKVRPPGTGQWMLVLEIGLPVPWPSELGLVTRNGSEWERGAD